MAATSPARKTATELLTQLIPGYGDLPDDDAGHDDELWRRYESAVVTAMLTTKTTPCTGPA